MCLDMVNPSTSIFNLVCSTTAFTGGTISARPTSTTEFALTSMQFHNGAAANGRISRVTDADGNFWFLWNPNGSGHFQFCYGFQKLVDTRPSDVAPAFSVHGYSTSGRGANSSINGAWIEGNSRMRHFNNSGVATALSVLSPSISTVLWNVTTANSIDGKADFFPAYVYNSTASFKGIRGRLPDCAAVASQAPVGASFPIGGAPEQVVVGNLLIPFTALPFVG